MMLGRRALRGFTRHMAQGTAMNQSFWRSAALAAAVAAVVAGGLAPVAAKGTRSALEERLGQREIVVQSRTERKSTSPRITAIAVVRAAPEDVWSIVSSCVRLQEVLDAGSVSQQMSRHGNRSQCQVKVSLPFPFGELVSLTNVKLDVQPGKRWRSTWTGAGGDFEINDGSWTLAPHGDDTLVVYAVRAVPKIPLPKKLLEQVQRSRMVAMMERLREVLEP